MKTHTYQASKIEPTESSLTGFLDYLNQLNAPPKPEYTYVIAVVSLPTGLYVVTDRVSK